MAKLRLYDQGSATGEAARYVLHHVLLATLKLLAPLLPYVTEEIYRQLFAPDEAASVHRACWPVADKRLEDDASEAIGALLLDIATAVRRYKSEHNLPLGTELAQLQLATARPALANLLAQAEADLRSVTRARRVEVGERLDPGLEVVLEGEVAAALLRG